MKNRKILNYVISVIYLILCLVISFNRIPFWDEARAWLVAQNCNAVEFLDMMKLECHFFIWYLIIFPFAKLNILYPYSIYILNTLFAAGAIFCLWNKSHFKIYEKLLITFSVPFLFLWGTVARCYSIGILFLFLALSFYKERFKKPYFYLLMLSLAANTSVMAFIGVFFLGSIFIFESRKEKYFKNLLIIFSFVLLMIFFQIYSPNPDYLKQDPGMTFFRDFIAYIFNPIIYIPQYGIQSILMSITRTTADICFILFLIFGWKNNKKVLFFTLSSYLSIVILLSVFYSGNFWHYFYFYLYFIVAFWILKAENKLPYHLNICFCIILICFMFKGSIFIDSKLTTVNDSTSKYIAYEILNNPAFKNKKLFCFDPWSDIAPSSLPYLKNKVDIYDINNNSRFSPKSMRSQVEFNETFFDADKFCKFAEDNAVLLTTTAFTNKEKNNKKRILDKNTKSFYYYGNNCDVSFIPYVNNEKIHLWSYLIKVNNKHK